MAKAGAKKRELEQQPKEKRLTGEELRQQFMSRLTEARRFIRRLLREPNNRHRRSQARLFLKRLLAFIGKQITPKNRGEVEMPRRRWFEACFEWVGVILPLPEVVPA